MKKIASGVAALLLAACAAPLPNSPSILVLPGTGKSFDLFRADEHDCRGYAYNQIGGKVAEKAQADRQAQSAAIGTAIGAVTGAALGGSSGAAVGAGVGLAGGAAVGADQSYAGAYTSQRRFDVAFTQCMYAKGHRVPVSGNYSSAPARTTAPSAHLPPPPPGQPPAEAPADYRKN